MDSKVCSSSLITQGQLSKVISVRVFGVFKTHEPRVDVCRVGDLFNIQLEMKE